MDEEIKEMNNILKRILSLLEDLILITKFENFEKLEEEQKEIKELEEDEKENKEIMNFGNRNIQKIGKSYFLSLPMNWCKTNSLDKKSKVLIRLDSNSNLIINTIK